METKREPVLVPMAILAGLQVLFAGLAGVTALSGYPWVAAVAACGNLAVAAAQTGVMFWVRGQVTPNEDVAATVMARVYDGPLPAAGGPLAAPDDPAGPYGPGDTPRRP